MDWLILAAGVHLIGAAVPMGRTGTTFADRLRQPLSLPIGVFVVSAAIPFIWIGLLVAGVAASPFL